MSRSTALRSKMPAPIDADISRVLSLRHGGRRAEALELAATLVAAAPRHPELGHVLGTLWLEAGEPARAVTEIERAIVLAPRNAKFYNSLGIALRGTNAVDRAVRALRKAVSLEPRFAEAHHNLGALLAEQGSLHEASLHMRAALSLRPDHADAALNLARVLARSPASVGEAIALLRQLLDHPRHGVPARKSLIVAAQGANLDDLPPDFSQTVCAWLISGDVSPETIEPLSWRLVLARPQTLNDTGNDLLLTLVLSRCLAASPAAERFVLELRRRALALAATALRAPPDAVNWLAPLAQQAFNAGFVYPIEPEEAVIAASLRSELEAILEAGELPDAVGLALFGLFAPLSSLADAERLLRAPADHWPAPLRPLIEQTLTEPCEEFRLRAEIPCLGAISNETSNQVRAQYETHPFPRWTAVPATSPRPLGAILRERLSRDDLPSALDGPIDVLIAGCGTGRSVALAASAYEEASIIGLDLSLASLAYGTRLCRALGFRNTRFIHGDLLELGRLGRRFDYIDCSGVLHHMADPLAGWRTLIESLAPHGVMHVALYSELGRRSVVAARARIQALGLRANDTDIRNFRRLVLEQPQDSVLARLTIYREFFYLSGCRDLLFHEVEHRFDLPGLQKALYQLGLEFLGFNLPSLDVAMLYRANFPEDWSMRDLGNWHRLESANPGVFASMYQFWCRPRAVR